MQRPGDLPANDVPGPPVIRGPREPVGYRRGFMLAERLQGLVLLIVGLAGCAGALALYQLGGLPGAPAPPPPPPGLRGMPIGPIFSVTNCMVPLMTIGSVGLVLVGLRRMFDPQP